MDDEQVMERYKKLVDNYGEQLPNPLVEPRRFEYFVKIFNWSEELKTYAVDSKPKG